ncbi:MAG TPA: PHB depolymerase family esterase [Herbaspirillum sp.]|jgi:poly(hydroxyalkanoate) depolymerase family esterase
MRFRNPFISAVLKATRTATRRTTRAMQKNAMKATATALQNAFKHGWPVDGLANRPKKRGPAASSKTAAGTGDAQAAMDRPASARQADGDHADVGAHVLEQVQAGQFVSRSLGNAAGTRAYKLYIPKTYTGQPMPLLVMLHGCTQDPDDFAAGTRMNRIAEEAGCFVAYPAQSKKANGHKCWNWFSAIDQQRDSGEASIIADITRTVIEAYGCDRRRIFVAGLSAGGAMAVIMGNRYPELYTAVGVHSGLPYAAARDLSSAMAAMRRGAVDLEIDRAHGADAGGKPLPIIVFHGDIDKTVHPRNGEQIIEQALAHIASTERKEQGAIVSDGVPQYTRAIYEDGEQRPMAELWTVHGTAHAWSGGSSEGSYTAAGGPDASAEMMRFFTTAGMQ